MNKLIKTSFLGFMLILGNYAFGQEAKAKFVASDKTPVTVAEQGGIKVTYIHGQMNGTMAISFVLQNTSSNPIAFSWALTNKSNPTAAVYTSKILKIGVGESIDMDHNPDGNMISFNVSHKPAPDDFTVAIKIISPIQK